MHPLQRSELAVPATSDQFIAKAAASEADAIFLDLEDAVPDQLKREAKERAIHALNEVDWGRKTISVRVNGLDTQWGFRDILDIAERPGRLDRILLPKCDTSHHLKTVELMLASAELARPREKPIGIEALIETASGLANVEAIASSGTRLEALIFGAGDYQLSMRIIEPSVGAPSPDYVVLTDTAPRQNHWNDPWHFALARVANACRANGLLPIDGPFTNFGDQDGFRSAARRALALGFEGKWAIHPSQIATANDVFSPSDAQIAWAHEVQKLLADARTRGRGAAKTAKGDMVDIAHGKMAVAILERASRVRDSEG
jgi:malyl-CoA/(S)-citramalyl-CoA lyase